MRDELMINKRATGINWTTAIFMGILHIGAVASCYLAGTRCRDRALVDFRQPRRRHGFSQTLNSSQLQDTKISGILSNLLRHTSA